MADYQSRLGELEACNARLIAASVDSEEDAQSLVEMLGLTFSVGYGLDFMDFAQKTGAFYEVRRSIIHATSFILRRDGTVAHAVYATGPIGRLTVDDCIRMLG
ncbi:MAG: redoxin domain-containing protein [Caldilineaceae bacterium]|nr:redoxin domain-containing protein [Caldilineaceae bacterium]